MKVKVEASGPGRGEAATEWGQWPVFQDEATTESGLPGEAGVSLGLVPQTYRNALFPPQRQLCPGCYWTERALTETPLKV